VRSFPSAILCDASIAAELSRRNITTSGVLAHDDEAMECDRDSAMSRALSPLFSWEELKKDANGLVPCVVQDVSMNDEVLMVAYMNGESFERDDGDRKDDLLEQKPAGALAERRHQRSLPVFQGDET
jgi:hypothetical protein